MKTTGSNAIIITGATRRLGFYFARHALEMGYAVIAHYRSSRGELERLLENETAYAKRVHFVPMDLCDKPAALIERAVGLCDSIAGLVNNASEFTQGDLRNQGHFRRMLDINALAPAALAAAFAEQIETGWIINITDAHIDSMNRRFQNYRISKRLLEELTAQLAFTLAPRIRVNAIAPGAMLPAAVENASSFDALARSIPLRKTGDIDALMRAFRYLIEGEYITGQTLFVDGGWHLST